MTTFPMFASSFRALTTTGITDVQTILNDFNSETVTNGSPAWTSPSGFTNGTTTGTWKSPVDSVGRYFLVQLIRTTALRLRFVIQDQNFLTVCDREIDIAGTVSVNYYTGQYHAWIESLVALPEVAWSGILDASPLPQGTYANYVYGYAYRLNNAGIDGGGSNTGQMAMIDNGAAGLVNRMRASGSSVTSTTGLLDAAGNLMYLPSETSCNVSGTFRWVGRPYQVFLVDTSVGAGTLKTVIIGNAGETGTFRVISGLTATENMRWAVRQA